VNCVGVDAAIRAVRALRELTDLPLTAFPNAGRPKVVDGRAVYGADPVRLAGRASRLAAAGACLVGGCCGTGPSYVRELARRLGKAGR
jgi:homocysteine S-methyltransferase